MHEVWRACSDQHGAQGPPDEPIPCDEFDDVINCINAPGCVFDYFSDNCRNASEWCVDAYGYV
jgi:hypothetical protein